MERPPKSGKPLKPVHFQILRVLLDGELHGYGIAKEIDARTDGGIRLEPGNLYRFIRRLVDEGLVERGADLHPGQGGRRRRAYVITATGRTALADDVARMRAVVRDAELALASHRRRQ